MKLFYDYLLLLAPREWILAPAGGQFFYIITFPLFFINITSTIF
jgi:hypothetical protein